MIKAAILAIALIAPAAAAQGWDMHAASTYLDARQTWWSAWPTAARDHQTACVSCHTALPYALSRPSLRAALGENAPSNAERKLIDDVIKRVTMWRDVEPFYPDQTNGLPKSSESRGTESILNALVLATRDAAAGAPSDEARTAFDNLWALQFRRGKPAGSWAWLNFHLEPWEADDAAYFGASLAAVAVGTEPGYASRADIQERLSALRTFLRRDASEQSLFNRAVLLWAASAVPDVLTNDERRAIVDSLFAHQNADGGWTLGALGDWKRTDGTTLDAASDGYATGLVTFALERAGCAITEPHVGRARTWLEQHQDRATGRWTAASINKKRDSTTAAANFMSDAATGFAVLALTYHPR